MFCSVKDVLSFLFCRPSGCQLLTTSSYTAAAVRLFPYCKQQHIVASVVLELPRSPGLCSCSCVCFCMSYLYLLHSFARTLPVGLQACSEAACYTFCPSSLCPAEVGTDTVLFLRAMKSVLFTKCLCHFFKL